MDSGLQDLSAEGFGALRGFLGHEALSAVKTFAFRALGT